MEGPYFKPDSFSVDLVCDYCGGKEKYSEKDILVNPGSSEIIPYYICMHCNRLRWVSLNKIPIIVTERRSKEIDSILIFCLTLKCRKPHLLGENTIYSKSWDGTEKIKYICKSCKSDNYVPFEKLHNNVIKEVKKRYKKGYSLVSTEKD